MDFSCVTVGFLFGNDIFMLFTASLLTFSLKYFFSSAIALRISKKICFEQLWNLHFVFIALSINQLLKLSSLILSQIFCLNERFLYAIFIWKSFTAMLIDATGVCISKICLSGKYLHLLDTHIYLQLIEWGETNQGIWELYQFKQKVFEPTVIYWAFLYSIFYSKRTYQFWQFHNSTYF